MMFLVIYQRYRPVAHASASRRLFPFACLVVMVGLGAFLAGCAGATGAKQVGTKTVPTTSPAPTAPIAAPSPTTSTEAIPAAPQATADSAARALISALGAGNRSAALQVATASAVDALFAATYTNVLAIDRGCSSSTPATCTFGPPGGGNPNDPIYELTVTQAGGWYVSAVRVES